jgi:hypothetical protein
MRNFKGNKLTSILLLLLVNAALLYFFYGKIIRSANSTYFAVDGDGLKNYFSAVYHAKYDSSWFRTSCMNYPYGEMASFTDDQPLLSGTIGFISRNIVDISSYTIGIMNILMIASILFGSLFLFLILFDLGIPLIFSLLISTSIAFLSPQLDRFGGHFALAYVFFIPAMFYFLYEFHKRNKYFFSILILILTYVASGIHMYFVGFYIFILLFYWVYTSIKQKHLTRNQLLHLFIQLILPIIFIELTIILNDYAPDRTPRPWGFRAYRAMPESVFLPFTMPYGQFLHKFMTFHYIPWEGIAYVGLVASIGFFILFGTFIKRLIKKKFNISLKVTDNEFLNFLFWASFLVLLYSFGFPFFLGLERLSDYIGPLRQMRSLGRFAWVFYYAINIVVFYKLWNWYKKSGNIYKYTFFIFCTIFIMYDAWINVRTKPQAYNFKFEALSDHENKLPENEWVKRIDANNFQAILPLPYFQIGSENYGKPPECNIAKISYLSSLKTKLPLIAFMEARASISQSLKNLEIILDPLSPLQILKDMPDEKPFLVVVDPCMKLTDNEKRILKKSTKIDSCNYADFFSLPFDSLRNLYSSYRKENLAEIDTAKLYKHGKFFTNQPDSDFIMISYDKKNSGIEFKGKGAFIGVVPGKNLILSDTLKNTGVKNYTASFWIYNIDKDFYPRSRLIFRIKRHNGEVINEANLAVSDRLVAVSGKWGLIEFTFDAGEPDLILEITLYNEWLHKGNLIVDEMLVRPSDENVIYYSGNEIFKNNRWFLN